MTNRTSTETETTSVGLPSVSRQTHGAIRVGLFDSGVGGLSVLRAVARELPDADLVYFADQLYCPYGLRPISEIRERCERITAFLLAQHCDVIVVACNTASAAALTWLRETFPALPIIGMEPAIKPAARATRTGHVAVLATQGTLTGELFAHTRAEYANEVEILGVHPKDWVERVERGEIDSPATKESVRAVVDPLLDANVDEIALGCTHYPFLAPLIQNIVGERATILDPSQAVAKQTAKIAQGLDVHTTTHGDHTFYTNGNRDEFAAVLEKLLGSQTINAASHIRYQSV